MKNDCIIVPTQSYRILKSRKYIQLHCERELKERRVQGQKLWEHDLANFLVGF